MKALKLSLKDSRTFFCQDFVEAGRFHENAIAKGISDVWIEIIEVTPEEYAKIPATNESAEMFAAQAGNAGEGEKA